MRARGSELCCGDDDGGARTREREKAAIIVVVVVVVVVFVVGNYKATMGRNSVHLEGRDGFFLLLKTKERKEKRNKEINICSFFSFLLRQFPETSPPLLLLLSSFFFQVGQNVNRV